MAVTAGALRELHRIHRQLVDLRGRLERGPRQIRARRKNLVVIESNITSVREEILQTRMNVDAKQLDLKSSESKILDSKTKLNSCSSNKEYQAFLEQIAAAKMAASVLSDEILELLERMDELEQGLAEIEKQIAVAQEEQAKVEQQVAEVAARISVDIGRLEKDLVVAETALPADFRVDYDRILRAKGADALATVEGSFCSGCYQQITPNMENNLTMDRPVFCLNCGALLYMPEDQSMGAGA